MNTAVRREAQTRVWYASIQSFKNSDKQNQTPCPVLSLSFCETRILSLLETFNSGNEVQRTRARGAESRRRRGGTWSSAPPTDTSNHPSPEIAPWRGNLATRGRHTHLREGARGSILPAKDGLLLLRGLKENVIFQNI